jgi:hypothetical protein
MRYCEFASSAKILLKISQQAQAAGANTAATPLPQNTAPTPAPAEPIKVYQRARRAMMIGSCIIARLKTKVSITNGKSILIAI